SEPITQTLPGGQKVEYSLSSPPNPRLVHELPVWAKGLRTAQWRGIDPNGDALRFRVEVSPEASPGWIPIADDIDVATWTFDTHTLSDGRYRLRVRASDRTENAGEEERTGEAVSAPFAVDNTPPTIPRLDLAAEPGSIRVSGTAEDAVSTLTRIEVARDGEDWRPVIPEGGFTDARRLDFRTAIKEVKPGAHSVGIRVVDASGNAATRAARVDVPAR